MKLFVYKGFPTDFLAALTVLPLVDSEIASKKNVLLFDNKVRRALDRSLLNMEDDEEFWITYEEYALLKDRVELAVKDYGLEVVIYINNLYPEYYPIEFDLNEELLEEIRNNLDLETAAEQTIACKNFLSVYNSLESIDGELFASFYNYELEKGLKVTVSPYYPAAFSQDSIDVVDLHVHITNDIPLFLKELMRIKRTQPHCISYSITNGILSERNLSSLRAYCQYNGISICERPMLAEQSVVPEEELIKIAQNDIKIPNFESFRKLRFYKNPDINNDVIEISQAKIISDIIAQAENAYVEPHNYRDIFITASTGAGKSVMFQIPAIYLAKKHKKLALYTGRNLEEVSTAVLAERKRKAFDEFRSGEKPVMLATKAFGMGVDINNIVNVYHYAVTGNLCDYVQEIGRVARKPGMIGYAITDYYYNDISFMQRLFGMSQIKQYQINLVLSGIYNTFKNKKENRSFLISPESFTYIFTGKNAHDNEDKQINKLKTCLLMLEKDLYDKYNFKVLVSRPQGIFTKAYVVIRKECEKHVLDSQYGKYFSFVAPGRVREKQSNSSETVSDTGDVFFLDLKAVWEDHYPNLSFPQFKYWYFNKNSNSKDKVEIMPSICDEFSVRQKVSVETKGELLLCDIRAKILEDFEYIADTLYATFKRTYFTLEEFAKAISPKYGATKARIISNSIFHLVDPESKCVKYRAYDDRATSQYTLSNGTFKEILNRSITRSQLIKNLDGNLNTSLSKFMPLSPEGIDATALKLLSIFDYATYEVVGGEQPEIFIRLNDPEKIRRIVYGEIKYSNSYVTKAKQKHEREVKILRKFFTDPLNDEARWDYVERYFLGDDVLREVESVAEEKVDFSKFVDKEKSYHINNVDSWDKIAFLFDENIQSIIDEFAELGIPLPNYLSTTVKHDLLDGEIVMSWADKNVIVFSETISEKDAAICAKKGWHPFELFAMEPGKLKEAIG